MQDHMKKRQEFEWREYGRIIRKRKWAIAGVVLLTTLIAAVTAIRTPNVYEARAVITTIEQDPYASGGFQNMLAASGLAGMVDLSPFGSSKLSELEQLLKSNVIMARMIERYDLLPVLFSSQWDAEKKEWKKQNPGLLGRVSGAVSGLVASADTAALKRKNDGGPSLWDGIRALRQTAVIKSSSRDNIITLSVAWSDPDTAAVLAGDMLETLRDHMAGEKQRVADANKQYLEGQLKRAVDPAMRQKIFYLLSKQVEMKLMSEVKENAGFKIIDPPRAPDKRSGPRRSQMVLMSFIVSTVLSVYLAILTDKLMKKRNAV